MSKSSESIPSPVMVTGATGYIAGWLVRNLLEKGYMVHAAVRDSGNPAKVGHLQELADSLPGDIRFFESDLLKEGSYAEAMRDCSVVFHTASPFLLKFENPQTDLIEPALSGTRNVLASVNATTSVKRVVVTSSCAAIYGDNADVQQTAGGEFTEEDWNTTSSLEHKPYSYSKTLAEREAWKMAKAQDRWTLVAINPSLVLGPGIQKGITSGSFQLIRDLAGGKMKSGVPDYGFGAVDVRDVAKAHLRAGLDIAVPSGRYIVSGHDSSLLELAAILRIRYGDAFPVPRRVLPKWLAWLFGPLVDKSVTRRLIARNVGISAPFNHEKSVRELGLNYRSLEESLLEMVEEMVEAGILQRRG
jgi:nucleoside-diphosphate-sugar epimerase